MKRKLIDFVVSTTLENFDIYNQLNSKNETRDLVFLASSNDVTTRAVDNICYPSDYAVINGALNFDNNTLTSSLLEDQVRRKSPCRYWLRTGGNTIMNKEQVMVFNDDCSISSIDAGCRDFIPSLRPSLELDVVKVVNAKTASEANFKVKLSHCDFIHDNEKYKFVVKLGEYPRALVGPEMSRILEIGAFDGGTIKLTGKKYIGAFDTQTQSFNYYNEYETKGDYKFVRVKNKIDGKVFWFKVEPITWLVKNWKELPKSINPMGTGTATTIKLQTEEAINSGIPFYTNEKDQFRCLWQNSTLRGYLNGINVNNIKYNGNTDCQAENGGDFVEQNFLTEALCSEMTLMNKVKQEEKNESEYNQWGIKVLNKPMSIDEQIKFYVDHGKSFMLHGPSGIGKSRRIEEIDPDFVSIVLRNGILPEEVIGKNIYPNNDKTKAGVWVPPAWYAELTKKCEAEPDKRHVLFIDEITNVKPNEQSLVFHLVLNNSIGPNVGKLPDNVVVAAAGNSIEESEAAYNMPEPLFRRFEGHIELKPDIQYWLEWGTQLSDKGDGRFKIHPMVASFVSTYGNKVFYSPYDDENPPKFAIDPRGWEQISDMIYDNNGVIARELIANKIGEYNTASFIEFACTPHITLESILNHSYQQDQIPQTFDAKYALALSLRFAKISEINEVRNFVATLGSEILAMFDTVWVGNDNEKAIYLANLQGKNSNINDLII